MAFRPKLIALLILLRSYALRFILMLWRALPRWFRVDIIPPLWRDRASGVLLRMLQPRSLLTKNRISQPYIIVGLLRSHSGIGNGSRLFLERLQSLGIETRYLDVSTLYGHADQEALPQARAFDARTDAGGTLVFHLNAPALKIAIGVLNDVCENRYRVGYWAWETPSIPDSWIEAGKYLNEIWVPSTFVADAVKRKIALPVRVVPHPVSMPVVDAGSHRARFGIPDNVFCVLIAFSMDSNYTRKNPVAGVHAFQQAFGDRADVLLIIKIRRADVFREALRELESVVQGIANIRIIKEDFGGNDHHNLMAAADVFLSLHRAEGFGLHMAEAMLMGRPVVATAWSGNMDFMDDATAALVSYDFVPVRDPLGMYVQEDMQWAEAHIDIAAAHLVRLKDDKNHYRELAQNGQKHAAALLTSDNWGGIFRSR